MSPRVSRYVRDGLTPKTRKFVKKLAKGETKAESYRSAGYKSRFPGQEAQKLLKKPEVLVALSKEQERLDKAFESGGITGERITNKYDELIDAEKDGQPDNTSQLKALDQIHKIRGDYAPEKSIHAHKHKHSLTEEMFKDLDEGVLDA